MRQYGFTSMTTNRKLVEEVYADVKSGKAPLIIEFQMGAPHSSPPPRRITSHLC